MPVELDATDLRILALLQQQGDLSAAELAKAAGLTTSTCWRRMSRLTELGVIRGRVALLDRARLGLGVLVLCQVRLTGLTRETQQRFAEAVQARPEILDGYLLTGEPLCLLRIACRDLAAYEAFLLDTLASFPGVESVSSSLVLTVLKETTALPLTPVPVTAGGEAAGT